MKIHFPNQKKTLDVPEKTRLSDVIRENFGPLLQMACGGGGSCGKCVVRLGDGRYVRACQTVCDSEMTVFVETPTLRRSAILTSFPNSLIEGIAGEEPWEKTESSFSIAFDLGTTTLAASIIHRETVLATVSRLNPQVQFGADVISRINYGNESLVKRKVLQTLLLRAVCAMAEELFANAAQESGLLISYEQIDRLVFAGNTTMEETLLGLDLTSLASVPFEPSKELNTEYSAGDSVWNGGLDKFLPETKVLVFPVIGAFVGGDISSGILAIHSSFSTETAIDGIDRQFDSSYDFFLDLGTNGEMVLETPEGRLACATAAGPCFEGAKISFGMCAGTGAIISCENKNGRPSFETFENSRLEGICGSALIDLTAELLSLGLLTSDGRLLEPEEVSLDVPVDWRCRILKKKLDSENSAKETLCFQIAGKIHVTQEDFRELQLAVGAIRTGIRLLLAKAGISASRLRTFRIAGGFGKGLRVRNAQKIGLIPASISESAVHFLGNTSLAGTIWAAASGRAWERAALLAKETLCIDLAQEENFSDVFMDSMFWEEF